MVPRLILRILCCALGLILICRLILVRFSRRLCCRRGIHWILLVGWLVLLVFRRVGRLSLLRLRLLCLLRRLIRIGLGGLRRCLLFLGFRLLLDRSGILWRIRLVDIRIFGLLCCRRLVVRLELYLGRRIVFMFRCR